MPELKVEQITPLCARDVEIKISSVSENRRGPEIRYEADDYTQKVPVQFSKARLANGLEIAIPNDGSEGLWFPPNSNPSDKESRVNAAYSGLGGLTLNESHPVTLDRLVWSRAFDGLVLSSQQTHKLIDGSNAIIRTRIHSSEPSQGFLMIQLESAFGDYGRIRTSLDDYGRCQMPIINYSLHSSDEMQGIQILFAQPGSSRIDLKEPFHLGIFITEYETNEEKEGIEELRKMKIPGMLSDLPSQISSEQLKKVVTKILGNIGQGKEIGNPLEHLVDI
jgi:hypothetical protein